MNRLSKNERLRSRKTIEHLLTHGKSFFVFPFRVVSGFGFRVSGFNFQLLIAVPKRRIKKAIVRNLIKRRTREAWRLHKNEFRVSSFELPSPFTFPVILQYVADEPLTYAVIEEAVKTIIRRLEEQDIKKLGD